MTTATSLHLRQALTCDMVKDCDQPITHIDDKGWIYCAGHGASRDRPCRRMTTAEIGALRRGETIWWDPATNVKDADPACPGSTVVLTTYNVEVILDSGGFWNRCTAPGCTYVSRRTASKAVARRWANAHDNDLPNDGGER